MRDFPVIRVDKGIKSAPAAFALRWIQVVDVSLQGSLSLYLLESSEGPSSTAIASAGSQAKSVSMSPYKTSSPFQVLNHFG